MRRIIERNIYPLIPLAIIGLFVFLAFTIIRASVFGAVDPEKHLFFEISFLLLLAMAAQTAVVYLKQPSVIILLLVGVLLSQSLMDAIWLQLSTLVPFFPKDVPRFITDNKMIQIFGQLGAIFILMKVGLHVKFGSIFNLQNSIVALLGVVLPFVAGYEYAVWNGGSVVYGMFLGAALAATSVGVTVALLKEFNLIKTKMAEVILGAAVIDDILGLLLLSFVSVFSSGSGGDISGILPTIINTVIFLAGGVLAGNYFVSRVLDKNEFTSKSLLLALSFAFAYSYLAEYLGLSSIVGAFLAGIIMNRSRHLEKIDEKTEGLELVFAPIFFISLGMLVDVGAIGQFLVPILAITTIAIISKAIGCGLGGLAIGLKIKESVAVGIGMIPRGEVALIVGLIGLTRGVLDSGQYTIIASMAFLTAILMPVMMQPALRGIKHD